MSQTRADIQHQYRLRDDELKRVLAHAQALQDHAQGTVSAREATAVGRELGIDPRYIEQALAAFRSAPPVGRAPVAWLRWLLPLVFGLSLVVIVVVWRVVFVSVSVAVPDGSSAALEDAFRRQLALIEEARPLIGEEAAELDRLANQFKAETSPARRLSLMQRLNKALGTAVFFRSSIGSAKAASIKEENDNLDSIFFFAAH